MKKLINVVLLLLIGIVSCQQASAQNTNTQSEKIVVDKNYLTPEQLQKIQEDERLKTMSEKIETYGKWVGVGNEVGVAVKEGLSAVTDVAGKFSDTNVGKFTMILIAWKVVGKDIVRIILGLIFILFATFFIVKSFNRYKTKRIMIEGTPWKPWMPRKYELVEPREFDGLEFVKVFHIFLLMISFGITYAIMFG